MSIFSLSSILTRPPKFRYGFWYSYEPTQAQGHLLTLSNFWAFYLSLALGLIVGWALSRLWRIICTLLFYLSYTPRPSWEESQNNVLIVNSKTALEGCIASYEILTSRGKAYRSQYYLQQRNNSKRYRRARWVLILFILVGLTTVGLKLAVPFLIALVPPTKLALVMPKDCGVVSVPLTGNRFESRAGTFTKLSRLSNAALSIIDSGLLNQSPESRGSPLGTEENAFPEHVKSLTDSCPPDVAACSTTYPFTFSSHYTLSSHHFGLNVDTQFSLHVAESCYRPRSAIHPVNPAELGPGFDPPENSTEYGAYYGPVTYNGSVRQPTLIVGTAQAEAGYAVDRVRAQADQSGDGWSPNSTLTQGGDTTLLLYYIGVNMVNQSSDPMFATDALPDSAGFYQTQSPLAPIICDTKYVFCDTNKSGNNCSSPGGAQKLLTWLEDRKSTTWLDIRSLLGVSLAGPPIYLASYGSAAVLAAQTSGNSLQYAPENATVLGELGRLSMAGMLMLGSYGQLSATGYWNLGNGAMYLSTDANPDSLCNKVVMESPSVTTLPVVPYVIFLVSSIFILSVSYAGSFLHPRKGLSSQLERLFKIWVLHTPGQLHKEATERLRGCDFSSDHLSMTNKWPDIRHQSGPVIAIRNGALRFGSGNVGLLENTPEGVEELTLEDSD